MTFRQNEYKCHWPSSLSLSLSFFLSFSLTRTQETTHPWHGKQINYFLIQKQAGCFVFLFISTCGLLRPRATLNHREAMWRAKNKKREKEQSKALDLDTKSDISCAWSALLFSPFLAFCVFLLNKTTPHSTWHLQLHSGRSKWTGRSGCCCHTRFFRERI